jgi:hypothetical protein
VSAFLPANATAATLAVAASKGVGVKAGGIGLGSALAIALGPLIGLAGGWFGMRMAAESGQYERERQFLLHRLRRGTLMALAFVLLPVAVMVVAGSSLRAYPAAIGAFWVLWSLAFFGWLGGEVFVVVRQARRIHAEELAAGTAPRHESRCWGGQFRNWSYRSRARLFGLPLVDIAYGGIENGRLVHGRAVGWIAIGEYATGILFASGGRAVGAIAIGGFACGLFAFGGLALGLLTFAGLGIGLWTFGGLAAGWKAFGGLAIGAAAFGGLAFGGKTAVGGLALTASGGDANTAAAMATINNDAFFQTTLYLSKFPYWIALISLALSFLPWLISGWIMKRHPKSTTKPSTGQSP